MILPFNGKIIIKNYNIIIFPKNHLNLRHTYIIHSGRLGSSLKYNMKSRGQSLSPAWECQKKSLDLVEK